MLNRESFFLPILPIGVVSKNDIGASRITSSRCSKIDLDALTELKLNSSNLPHVAMMAEKLIKA
jgi:hypothetical protein